MQSAECGVRKNNEGARGRGGDAGKCAEIAVSPLPRVSASWFRRPTSDFARSAFTLLEILLALGLTALLLGAIFSAITLYAKLATAGRDETERLRLARILRPVVADPRQRTGLESLEGAIRIDDELGQLGEEVLPDGDEELSAGVTRAADPRY